MTCRSGFHFGYPRIPAARPPFDSVVGEVPHRRLTQVSMKDLCRHFVWNDMALHTPPLESEVGKPRPLSCLEGPRHASSLNRQGERRPSLRTMHSLGTVAHDDVESVGIGR